MQEKLKKPFCQARVLCEVCFINKTWHLDFCVDKKRPFWQPKFQDLARNLMISYSEFRGKVRKYILTGAGVV